MNNFDNLFKEYTQKDLTYIKRWARINSRLNDLVIDTLVAMKELAIAYPETLIGGQPIVDYVTSKCGEAASLAEQGEETADCLINNGKETLKGLR